MPWPDLSRIDSWMESAEERLGRHFAFLLAWVALLAAVEAADQFGPWHLDTAGIRPRSWSGMAGILAAPFLHAGWSHLISNAVPLAGLAWLTLFIGWRRFWIVTALTALGSGGAVWAFGPADRIHLGASALVFGYLGHLLVYGLVRRSPAWILAGVIVALLYGSLLQGLWGESAMDGSVSWIGHASGFAVGMAAAIFPLHRAAPDQ